MVYFCLIGGINHELCPTSSYTQSCDSSIQQLCCSCLKALTAILKDSQQSKEIFSSVIGYAQLLSIIEKLCPLNQTILEAVKEMVSRRCYKHHFMVTV